MPDRINSPANILSRRKNVKNLTVLYNCGAVPDE